MTLTEMIDNNLEEIKEKIKKEYPYGFTIKTELPEKTKKEFLEHVEENKERYKNDEKPYLFMLQDYLFENDFFMDNEDDFYNMVRDTVENFLKNIYFEEYEDAYEEATYDEIQYLQDIAQENVEIDYCFESILEDLKIDEVVLFISPNEEDVEDNFHSLSIFGEENGALSPSNFSEETLEEALVELEDENNETSPLNWLMQTQGYELIDLYDKDKVENSVFLKTLTSELSDYQSELNGSLVFRFPDVPLEQIFNFEENKENVLVKAGDNVEVGIYDCVYGSGSGMQIELEKALVIPKEFIQVSRTGKSIGYMPSEVYGYMEGSSSLNTTKEQPITLKEIDLKQFKELAKKRTAEFKQIEKIANNLNAAYKENDFSTEATAELGTEPYLKIDDAYEGNYGEMKEAIKKIDNFKKEIKNITYFGERFDIVSNKNEKDKKIKISLEKIIKPSDLVAVGEFSKESDAKFEIKSKSYDNNFTATINKGIIEVESKKDVNPYTEEKFLMEIGKEFKGKIFCEGKEFNVEAEIQKQEQKKANSLIRN